MNPRTSRYLVKGGLWLHGILAALLIVTVAKMITVFEEITVFGTGDSRALSAGIGDALHYAAIGYVAGFLGLILIFIGVVPGGYRERWVFWSGVVAACLWIVAMYRMPVIGITVIAVLVWNRGAFLQDRESKAAQPGATDNPDDAQRLRKDH